MSGNYILISREAYSDLCLKAAALDDIRAEIGGLSKEPPRYVPNYDAYKRCFEIIEKHIKGEEKENVKVSD